MVYLTHSESDPTPQPQMAPPENTDGSIAMAQQVLVAIGGTLACMMTVCIVVTFTRCCCRRRKDESSDEEPDQEYGQTPPDVTTVQHDAKTAGKFANVITELQCTQAMQDGPGQQESSCSEDANALSVKDRIRAFETRGSQPQVSGDVRMRDTPKRKKPKSKAFEDFESQGILIGFGNVPRDKLPHGSLDEFPRDGASELDPDLDALRRAHSVEISHYMERNNVKLRDSNRSYPSNTEAEGEDDFEAVQRNSAILKSFRRAPPPKNRNRARRSGRKKQREDTDHLGDLTDGHAMSSKPPPHRLQSEEDNFEQSLHMPSDRPQRRSQFNGTVRPYTPTQNGHSSSEGESDASEGYEYYQPRRRSLSESGPMAPRERAKKTVTYYSTQGLTYDSNEGQSSQGHEELASGEGPVSFDCPPHQPQLQTDNRYYSSPHVRMSPQRHSPESPSPMRKWGSDAVQLPRIDAHNVYSQHNMQGKPNTEKLERKFRHVTAEEERTYPKSEQLSRKPFQGL